MYSNSKINAVLILSYWICNYVLLVQGTKLSAIWADKEPPGEWGPDHHNESPKLVTEERTSNVVKSRSLSIGRLFSSMLQFIVGKLKILTKPTQFALINSDAVFLFREMRDTQCVKDKTEMIKKVTDYIQQSRLYTGRFKYKSDFGEQFDKIKTTGNGDCFYNAISLLFFGHEHFARALRVVTAAHIAINEDFRSRLIAILLENDITWISVLDVKKFAESVEIVFLSNVLCRLIKIYESSGRTWYQYPLIGCESPKEPLHLHLSNQHYSALRMKPKFPPIEADTFQLTDLPPLNIL